MAEIDDSVESLIRTIYKGTKERQPSPGEHTLSSSSQTLSSKLFILGTSQFWMWDFIPIHYFKDQHQLY